MSSVRTTVFGGTGFLGSRIARQLAEAGGQVRIVARNPERPDWSTPAHDIELVEGALAAHGRRRLLLPLPMFAWRVLVTLMELLPNPPLTYDQVVLMARDNLPRGDWPGFADLRIEPRGVLEWLEKRA